MALTTLSVALSVLVLKVHHTSPSYEVPGWVRRHILGAMSSAMSMDVKSARRRYVEADCSAPNNKIWSITDHRLRGNPASDNHHQAAAAAAGVY